MKVFYVVKNFTYSKYSEEVSLIVNVPIKTLTLKSTKEKPRYPLLFCKRGCIKRLKGKYSSFLLQIYIKF